MYCIAHRMAHHNHLIDGYYLISSFVKLDGDKKPQEFHLSTCIQHV